MSTRDDKVVYVHQALHGYADGHRLIEASRPFPRQAERTMLLLSDMSGPTMIDGFKEYITGYPLPDGGAYAFAKTWYAAEMERPGCVWTHTLLIENVDLAKIQDPRVLLKLFMRPRKDQSWSVYKSWLRLPINDVSNLNMKEYRASESFAISVVTALYGLPHKPVFIPAHRADQHEDLLLAIWSQQWPRLRRSFSFCTGSLSNRKLNERLFDIQVIPQKFLESMKREVPKGEFINDRTATDSQTIYFWASEASKDLFVESGSSLRRFLWNFGAESSDGRAIFSSLVETFLLIEKVRVRDMPLSKLIEAVKKHFPTPDEAASLKAAIFKGVIHPKQSLLPNVVESDLLRQLVTTRYHTAFDAKTLGICHRAKALWEFKPDEAQRLVFELADSKLTPLGEEFLAGIFEIIKAEDVLNIWKEVPSLLPMFVKRNPALATSPLIWQLPIHEQRELWHIISTSPKNLKAVSKKIVMAMVTAGADTLADDAVNLFEKDAVDAILDWFNTYEKTIPKELANAWRQALQSRPGMLLQWLKRATTPREASVALIAGLLDPNSPEVLRFGTKVWLRFARTAFAKLNRKTLIDTMAFILALGFNNPDPEAAKLVAQAFQVVYDAAKKDELGYESWLGLKDVLPSLHWWQDWDKCELLRRGLVERFICYEWPTKYFLQAVKSHDAFLRIVDYCSSRYYGRKFLRRVADQIAQHEVKATSFQREIIFGDK